MTNVDLSPEALNKIRLAKLISFYEIAREADVSYTTVKAFFRGEKRRFHTKSLRQIYTALGVMTKPAGKPTVSTVG
jgi:hypothetical protein